MYTTKLVIAYDGTHYAGWQIQPNATSIQALVQQAVRTIVRESVHVIGSGRTDAGVHALGQVAHFCTTLSVDPILTLRSLNGLLPADIRVLSTMPVTSDFHAQRSALSKIYHYRLWLGPVHDPFHRRTSHHFPHAFDLNALQEALPHLQGTHDFTSFANAATEGAASKNPVRTLSLELILEPSGLTFVFQANGFLYKMVRNLTGALIDVGRGKLVPADIPCILAARDRRLAPAAAPAHGLTLVQVFY